MSADLRDIMRNLVSKTIGLEIDYSNDHFDDHSFPLYNILKLRNTEKYTIELAVAGFSEDEITINRVGNTLTIVGERPKIEDLTKDILDWLNRFEIIHRGITQRDFTRKFVLGNNIEVGEVSLENGILTIELERVAPVENQPQKIDIIKK